MKNRNLNILPEKAKNDMIGVVELLADTTSDMLSNVDFDKGNFHVAIYINDDLKSKKKYIISPLNMVHLNFLFMAKEMLRTGKLN